MTGGAENNPSRSTSHPTFPQDAAPRRGESGHISHLCAGYKCSATVWRQTEQIEDPGKNDVFEMCCDRRNIIQARILIPGICQPVSRNADWQSAADDPSEETPTHTRHRRR